MIGTRIVTVTFTVTCTVIFIGILPVKGIAAMSSVKRMTVFWSLG